MTRSLPLARPSRASASGGFLSPLPERLKSPGEREKLCRARGASREFRLNPAQGWHLILKTRIFLCAAFILLAPSPVFAQSREYQIKAAFIFNFAQFVFWPATAFTNAEQPFQVGVLGDNPFGKALEETVRGETIQGRRIVIVQSSSAEKLAGCQILFVCKSEAAHFNDIFSKLDSKPVLTVSEDPKFIQHGGVVNFYRDGPKVRFEINPDAADKNGLKVGSELLSVGKIVHSNNASQ